MKGMGTVASTMLHGLFNGLPGVFFISRWKLNDDTPVSVLQHGFNMALKKIFVDLIHQVFRPSHSATTESCLASSHTL